MKIQIEGSDKMIQSIIRANAGRVKAKLITIKEVKATTKKTTNEKTE